VQASTPPLRRVTRIYLVVITALAALLTVGFVRAIDQVPATSALALAFVFASAFALAVMCPLPFAWKTRVSLDTSVLVAAVLIFEPGIVLLIILGGALLAQAVAREAWVQALFNTSQTVLQAAVAGLILLRFSWQPANPAFDDPLTFVAIALAGAAMYLVNTLSVAAIIGFQERLAPLRVWSQATANLDPAEVLAHLGQVGVGLLAAVIADAHAWALALLFLPAAAIYGALRQHTSIRLRYEEALRGTEANLEEAQRIAHLGSWEWNLETNDRLWSDEAFRILGIEDGDAREVTHERDVFIERVHPLDRERVQDLIGRALRGASPTSLDHRILRPDRTVRTVHTQIEVVFDGAGKPARVLGTLHDITDRKQLEERLTYQAFHDALTGLPNRALFTDRLQHALDRTRRQHQQVAVLFLDLDHFKLINDTLGHEAGDQLLIAVAERVRACLRPSDTVARLGGDEFTILLEDIVSRHEVETIAERITTSLGQPFVLSGQDMYVTTSIGIVFAHDTHAAPDDLLRDADVALYRAKDNGRARYAIYDASMGAAMRERVELETDLRKAIERDELSLHYQPIVELETRDIVGFEAFLRWEHPRRGAVSPASFIPIAEETGLIGVIDSWVLDEACRQVRYWQESGHEHMFMSVNVSGRQLRYSGLHGQLRRMLAEHDIDPRALKLEMSEAAVMADADLTASTLEDLLALGVEVVIDDFGTGYFSLSRLKRFPINLLKLDGSFVSNLSGEHDAEIARAVIGLAHTLGLQVIAEGIESPDQLQQLRELRCRYGQGNYLSAPLTRDQLDAFLPAVQHVA
jgi:diguanylate cyclase (GGDEF)-like protein/PAS domain S-box-containing protein